MPVGGGPPARSPHASLRLGVVDLEARPGPATAHRHRGQALRFAARPCPPVPLAPSAPVVPGRCCLVRRVLLQTSSIRAAYCAVYPALVTNVVNPTAFLRKIVIFGLRLTTFVTRVLVRRFELRWFDDVCNVGRPLVARPGPAAAHGRRSQTLSARWLACLKPRSPLLTCVCGGLKPPSPLRAQAEPHLKPVSPLRVRNGCFLVRFSLALVLSVSMGVVQGRALVIVVSRWPVSVVVEVSLVSPSHLSASFARKSSPCGVWWWV